MKSICLLIIYLSPVFGLAQEMADLTGVWELDLDRQVRELQKDPDSKFTAMPGPVQEMFLKSLETRKYIFYADGRFEAYWLLGGKSHVLGGTWEFKFPDNLSLSLESGQDKKYAVSFQKEILKLISGEKTENVLHTLYLKREVP
ncbi:hypothetical protein SAMN04488057_105213 [Cyclobacterium lianum]|uniref:Lipocalin-like domain-containing protein n=1 Tax=Cyclobacterium lianum TaxID=388280 RepID=A0A1M7ND23_9BACT|nr:hypothetical protein [Cyclobacterium lianum]SHN01437.1 hypothetical protein SAMN04488057_105213 [Cyclobacterium lianum]